MKEQTSSQQTRLYRVSLTTSCNSLTSSEINEKKAYLHASRANYFAWLQYNSLYFQLYLNPCISFLHAFRHLLLIRFMLLAIHASSPRQCAFGASLPFLYNSLSALERSPLTPAAALRSLPLMMSSSFSSTTSCTHQRNIPSHATVQPAHCSPEGFCRQICCACWHIPSAPCSLVASGGAAGSTWVPLEGGDLEQAG